MNAALLEVQDLSPRVAARTRVRGLNFRVGLCTPGKA
jgi:hypothetical protein